MNWSIFLLMLPHLKPKCLDILFPELYRTLDVARVISLLVLMFLFLRKKQLPSPPIWVLGALEAWICLVAAITGGDFVETCSLAVSVVGVTMLADYYSDRMKELLTALMLNYEWLVYANLLTVLLYPDTGIAQDPEYNNLPIYFFGPDNWFMYLCIPAVCVALLYLRMRLNDKRKVLHTLRALCLVAASYACAWLQKPMTTLLAMAVMAAALAAAMIPGFRCCVNFPLVLTGTSALNLTVVVLRITQTCTPLNKFMFYKLHKSATLSERTVLWDDFLEQIQGKLWFGLGTPKQGYFLGDEFYDHLHNQLYDLLAQGGIPALVLFLATLLLAGKTLTVHRKSPAARIMTACMAGLLVMCIPEVCRHGSIFLLFPLAYHVDKIEKASLS